MIQADSELLGCVCPECGSRCRDCLGTDTVVSREALRALAADPRFSPEAIASNFAAEDAGDDEERPGGTQAAGLWGENERWTQ